MYSLNSENHVVDAYGRVLLGMDGMPIQVESESFSGVEDVDMGVASASTQEKCGWKLGNARPKTRAVKKAFMKASEEKTCDLALTTLKQVEGVWWFVGETLAGNTKTDKTVAKAWKRFKNVETNTSVQSLKDLAWELIQETRKTFPVELSEGLLTPQEDAQRLADMTEKPSVLARKAKDEKTKLARFAKGLTGKGKLRKRI